MTWFGTLCLLAACCSSLAACGPTDSAIEDARADTLWVPAQAVLEDDPISSVRTRSGRSVYRDDGGAGVVFSVGAGCDDVARALVAHFGETEWRPRAARYLNPRFDTFFDTGCERHGGGVLPSDADGHLIPREPWIEWHGEWENARGDIVSYAVGGTTRQVHGYGAYVPRHMVDAARRIVSGN